MPEITLDVVAKIAHLANLKLTPQEREIYTGQLEHILQYIHQLNQLSTENVPETTHAFPMNNVWREDRRVAGLSPDEALAAAPDAQDHYFRVPRIID